MKRTRRGYPRTRVQKKKFARVMREYGRGELFTPQGRRVKNQKQAVAIALSEARRV